MEKSFSGIGGALLQSSSEAPPYVTLDGRGFYEGLFARIHNSIIENWVLTRKGGECILLVNNSY
jgi:hypothetical protein